MGEEEERRAGCIAISMNDSSYFPTCCFGASQKRFCDMPMVSQREQEKVEDEMWV